MQFSRIRISLLWDGSLVTVHYFSVCTPVVVSRDLTIEAFPMKTASGVGFDVESYINNLYNDITASARGTLTPVVPFLRTSMSYVHQPLLMAFLQPVSSDQVVMKESSYPQAFLQYYGGKGVVVSPPGRGTLSMKSNIPQNLNVWLSACTQ